MQSRPYLDTRVFAEIYSKKIGARLIVGDLLLSTELLYRAKNAEYLELQFLKFRMLSPQDESLIDMRKYAEGEGQHEFRAIGDEVCKLIENNRLESEHLFIYASRRGMASVTVCHDCETVVSCKRCSSPVVLHAARIPGGRNYFLCHKCGERRDAAEKCTVCGSWNLVPLGIGIDRIEQEIKRRFPDIKIFMLDRESAATHKQALAIVERFHSSPGSVLVGTEMALLYLGESVDNAAVASIDSLFSLPDFRMNERVLSILLRMKQLARKRLVIQTRKPEQKVFEYALKGSLIDFYRDEIKEREFFDYPPFSTLIKITAAGEKSKVVLEMEKLKAFFKGYDMVAFPAFIHTFKGKHVMHALLKVARTSWPDKALVEKLMQLPPYLSVRVDPESLL
jgi:primosomal protein N' (replication factor Y)